MNYICQFTTGGKFKINKQEAETIATAKDDKSITLTRLGVVIQKRMVIVYPESLADEMHDRKKQQTGVLHDGEKARRHYGQWVDFNSAPDDIGNYAPVALDKNYYPEIAMDCVATEEEYNKIKADGLDYYDFLGIGNQIKKLENKASLQKITFA